MQKNHHLGKITILRRRKIVGQVIIDMGDLGPQLELLTIISINH